MALILKYFDGRFDFEAWKSLADPDVYRLQVEHANPQKVTIEHLWK